MLKKIQSSILAFKFIYLLIALCLIIQLLNEIIFFENFIILGISATLYLLSHFLRALRLRFIISSNEFDTKNSIFVQFGAAALGNLLFPLAKDLLAIVFVFIVSKKNLFRSLISVLYLRFFDFLVITPLLYIIVLSGEPEKGGLALSLLLLLVLILFILITLPKICKIIVDYLIKYSHTKRALYLIRFFSSINQTYTDMNLNNMEKSLIIMIMTAGVWFLELMSVYVLGMNIFKNLLDAYFYMLSNVIKYIPYTPALVLDSSMYNPLYLSLLMIASVSVVFFKKSQN
jgi:hypothetical protein